MVGIFANYKRRTITNKPIKERSKRNVRKA